MPKLLSAHTRAENDPIVRELKAIMLSAPPASVAATLRALADRVDSSATLDTIDVRTLVIVGRDDAITPPDDARMLAARIRGARMIQIEHAGHVPNLEQPAVFNRALTEFLRSFSA